jgi:ribonuclease HI
MTNLNPTEFFSAVVTEAPIDIFTDGACSGNPGPGGWGVVFQSGDTVCEMSGGEAHTTNNRMEMMASLMALESSPEACSLNIYTDSSYLKDGITSWVKKWKKNNWRTSTGGDVKNKDLWERIDASCELRNVQWHWVKGHSGHPGNERADTLAVNAVIKVKMNS